METLYQTLRILHIGAGMTAFFVAPVALLARKGGKAHAFWGNVFFWGMVAVAASAVPLTVLNPNAFLFLVAVFSFHLSLSGYRAVVRRRAARIDLAMAAATILFYLALAGWGVHLFTGRPHHPFGYVSLAFAGIGLRFSGVEIYRFFRPPADRMAWWYDHMQGMVGSYIAAVSAFSAVNFVFLPDVLRWLWPTLVGAPLLAYWKRHYQRRFRGSVVRAA